MSTSTRRGVRVRWFRVRTLRARVTVVAGLGITVAVVLGLVLLFLLQRHSIRADVDGQLRTYATQIEQAGATGAFPDPLPQSTLDVNAEAQVIGNDGRVRAASRPLAGVGATYLAPDGTTPVRQHAADGLVPADVRVVAVATVVRGSPVTIVTWTSAGLISLLDAESAARLLVGLPAVLGLSAATVWLIVGRALKPVERIRRAVTEITSVDLTRRVPEPATDDEVGRLADTMNDMLARLDDAAARQRRFVSDASHDLRSPLAALRTTLEIALAHPDKAPWPTIVARAAAQTARLEDLLNQLFTLAKADEGQLVTHRGPVDVAELLDGVPPTLAPHRVDVRLSVDSGSVTVGDPAALQRLFRNIVDNATHHATHRVDVTGRRGDGLILVHVDDDGPGIPAAERDRVFDRFVRLDSSRDRTSSSTGLGLAIAREIAHAHGAVISIGDAPAGGARVTVQLPAAPHNRC